MNRKFLFATIILILVSADLQAQQLGRHEAVVVYVYNFAKNITWPNESSLKEFDFIIVTNDPVFNTEFNKLAKTKTLRNKPIKITATNKPTDFGEAELIYLDREFESSLTNVLNDIEGKNILMVTDRFADKRFVMINFVQSANTKLQFEINKANIINQKLVVGPDMIMLGGSEIDVASLYKESQQSLLSMQKKLDQLASSSEELKLAMKKNEEEIGNQVRVSAEQNTLIEKQQRELKTQKENLELLQNEALSKSTSLNQKNEELKQKEELAKNQETQIRKGEEILKALNTSIDSLNSSVSEKEKVLNLQGYTIASQSKILYGLLTIIGLVLFSTFILLRWYRQKKLLVEELNLQKAEISEQHDIVATQNEELTQSQEEIAAQRDMVELQNKKLEESRAVIEKQNEEIRMRNDTLEVEVENRTRELVEYNQQLEQFAFISAHNLRAPVARILGLGHLLELPGNNDHAFITERLISTTRDLDRVVRDLNTILEVRKNNTAVISEILLEKELELLKTNLSAEISETQATIETDFSGLTCIRTIRPYFESIFVNLISNAIKYRKSDTNPIIKIKAELRDSYICFIVSDNGLGIDLNQFRDKVFKLYSRFHNHVEGKGLGLYLVKTQITALGGRIEIESEVDKGTTFYVYLKSNI